MSFGTLTAKFACKICFKKRKKYVLCQSKTIMSFHKKKGFRNVQIVVAYEEALHFVDVLRLK